MIRKLLPLIAITLLIISCQKDDKGAKSFEINYNSFQLQDSTKIAPGTVRVLVTDDFAKNIENSVDESGIITKTSDKSMSEMVQLFGAAKFKRTFPHAGKFEARTRREGLHLWYDLYFDKSITPTKANKDLRQVKGVVEVEFKTNIKRMDVAIPFNDPDFSKQWHYYNDGSGTGYIAGSDINVLPVWKSYTKGNKEVIVSIVDGGVDFNHEDLKANMWINTAEFNGSRSQDDDGNGYIDDIYGFNFIRNMGTITADDHGTHVAGTVGAVNNNGKGVAGVAGGDAANNIPGVRLMSCQIFSDEPEDEGVGANTAAAIKYGADNGAIISQNSWGYEDPIPLPSSIKAAIDYFVKYAGVDENGNQYGPMKGGIVIFAAGNDNRQESTPPSYEGVLSVAAIGPNFAKATYSNYGSWVDISAPGGESGYGRIYSTYPSNQYGYMRGTSMACPHVSGVAALVASYYGAPGFTNEMLWDRLVDNTTDIYEYNRGYAGKLGTGMVNALAAIASSSVIAPSPVSSVELTTQSNNITVKWKVTADQDDVKAYGFTVYYSTEPIPTGSSKSSANIYSKTVTTGDLNVGDEIGTTLNNLEFSKRYYISVDAYDFSSNRSAKSPTSNIVTEANKIPVIVALDGITRDIKAYQTTYINFSYSDPDGHTMTWKLVPGSSAATATESNGKIQVSITGINTPAGSYTGSIEVKDVYGAVAIKSFDYIIRENNPPLVAGQPANVYIEGIGQSFNFDLSSFITDADGEPLSYTVQSVPSTIVHANVAENKIYLTSLGYGLTEVTVTATDALNKSASVTFKSLVRDGSKEIDLYPNPVKDYLYVRAGSQKPVEVSIFSSSGAKVYNSNLTISPFDPAKIDMKSIAGGVYNVVVKMDGKEIKNNIVKL